MLHLLHIEWLKLKNYRTFWILSILFILSLYGINNIVYIVQAQAFSNTHDPMAQMILGNPPFRFPEVWQTVTWISHFLLFFPGLIIIIIMTNEFSFKTHRQNVIDGLSRMQFITVKIMLAVLIAFVSALAVLLISFIFGLREHSAPISFQNFEFVGYFFVQALNYTLLALLFATLMRRSGIAIGVYFLYSVILERALVSFLTIYAASISNYMPLDSSNNLIPFPLFRSMIGQVIKYPDVTLMLITSVIYLCLYVFMCRWRFTTSDL